MKLVTIVSSLFLFFSPFVVQEMTHRSDFDSRINLDDKEILIFDGYEGGYLFFTNVENQAVVLEIDNEKILKKIDLINGDFIGKKLKVSYKEKLPSDQSSSMGVINFVEME